MSVLSGAPSSHNYMPREEALMPHHALQHNMMAQMQAFSAVTIKSTLIMSAETAAGEIDETLRLCLSHCLPIFIEIPSDIAAKVCVGGADRLRYAPISSWQTGAPHNPTSCAEAVSRTAKALLLAKRPALLAGVECDYDYDNYCYYDYYDYHD
ncbi:hypothetical protein T492DRAFT_893079 [Pavlovales sp. CCMP2436]|nr:hypothetical protein T492DRAFT_893079 [Pavlovales sp. CCMP2436]